MLICLCPVSIAQHAIIMKYHVSHLKMRPCYPTDSVRVDKSYMTVSYRYAQLAPDADTLEWTIIRMAIGKHKISQQDMYLYYDRVRAFAAHEQQPGLSVLRDRFGSGPSNLFVDLIYDKNGKDMQVACGDYLDVDAGKKYVQSLPELQWEIGHGKDTIEGLCAIRPVRPMGDVCGTSGIA